MIEMIVVIKTSYLIKAVLEIGSERIRLDRQ